ncbi:MAG: Ig domain-containing protein [Alistipes sp.]|nr:Ig domain-containing protein [Alistipes sp.]
MKSVKRSLALFLAVLLTVSGIPAFGDTVAAQEEAKEEIYFNTGSLEVKVVEESELEDSYDCTVLTDIFDENGNYTINIPEPNPFFPYEVQFTFNGEKWNEWFMSPDDSVEIGGHIFTVSAYMDGTQATQITLEVGGKEVVVYPEAKEFTNDPEGGIATMSLLPLEEKRLTVDLTAYNPLELTMVKVKTLLQGENVADNATVAWTQYYGNDFDIIGVEDSVNLKRDSSLQLIVGDGDQLNPDNVRYIIEARTSDSMNWLVPVLYSQTISESGNIVRNNVEILDKYTYYSSYYSPVLQCVGAAYEDVADKDSYVSFAPLNNEIGSYVKVFAGNYQSAEEAQVADDLTESFFCTDMEQNNAGLKMDSSMYVTIVAYSAEGEVVGCLPIRVSLQTHKASSRISFGYLYDKRIENDRVIFSDITTTVSTSYGSGNNIRTYKLYDEYSLSGIYYTYLNYYNNDIIANNEITAVFQGNYRSISEAVTAGAENIKDEITSSNRYVVDFSKEVYFTIFIGQDGEEGQKIYHYQLKTEESGISEHASGLHGGTAVSFTGLNGEGGKNIAVHKSSDNNDSYGAFKILLVGEDTDLTNIAPEFRTSTGVNLYAVGSSSPEVSGENYHDFSNGPIQYTAAAENGSDSENYWLYIVKPSSVTGVKQLYISSLADSSAVTTEKDGVIYTTREIMLDSLHSNDLHNILLTNIGTDELSNLSVELTSEVVELDDYWTLHGKFGLSGFNTIERSTSYGELPNFAKIVLKKKEGIEDGTDVSGTLTIKSGDTTLIVMNLTGTVGNPSIVTSEIPGAVKYVPYGTMIQNSNKYSWNKVSYELYAGALPEGMVIKPNGELYGVPKEEGEFTFTVRMTNSYTSFSSDIKTFTLNVAENTDENVDNATDTGYELKERIIDVGSADRYLIVSSGIFPEFQDIYLDGIKLQEGEDYEAESGSTRITIKGQTLENAGEGTHTLGMEFRETDSNELKRAAQNYTFDGNVGDDDQNSDSNIGSDSQENIYNNSIDYQNADEYSNAIYRITYLGNGSVYVSGTHRIAKAYDISLNDENAQFPITIVMKVPSGMDITKTKILHLNSQNGVDETFYYGKGFTYNPADNTVTFTVTHLSKFIFVEMADSPLTADHTPLGLYLVLMALSIGSVVFITLLNKKKKYFE